MPSYDVFISYSNADSEWVRGWLVPQLKAANVAVCTDAESFDIGVPVLVNMENAVANSRHTLLVMSPSWVTSQWARFEALLILQEDPSGLLQRTLPVLRQACELPRRIAFLTYADLSGARDQQAELDRILRAIRGERQLPDAEQHLSTRSRHPQPTRATPAATFRDRLANLGFERDPFIYPEAEKMPSTSLDETFVAHPGFFEHVMDLDRSTVLLAAPGSGKTAGRLRLEMDLRQQRLAGPAGEGYSADIPLVVNYSHFVNAFGRTPQITIEQHAEPLLGAIAASAYSMIEAAPQQFMLRDQNARDWWWAFFGVYQQGEELEYRLRSPILLQDWQRKSNRVAPFRANTDLQGMLEVIERRIVDLGVRRLCILVDEVDGYLDTKPLAQVTAIIATILNALPLLSMSWMFWKFFLPNALQETVYQSRGYQTGRLQVVPITWDTASLREFLQLRLDWASNGTLQDIEKICDQELLNSVQVEDELIALALRHNRLGPPRALLDLGRRLLGTIQGELLGLEDWEQFSAQISSPMNPL